MKTNKTKQVRELREKLAKIEHQRWSDWQKWCHKVLRENCPSPELEVVLKRWDKQIKTEYKDLTEKEKQSDREQVDRYLPIILEAISNIRKEVIEEIVQSLMKDEDSKYWAVMGAIKKLNSLKEEIK